MSGVARGARAALAVVPKLATRATVATGDDALAHPAACDQRPGSF